MTSLRKFVKLSMGMLVTAVQFVVAKSGFSCRTRFIEGTVQERRMFVSERVMFNSGAKVVCKVKISPQFAEEIRQSGHSSLLTQIVDQAERGGGKVLSPKRD